MFFVYGMQAVTLPTGNVKIGFSSRLRQRLGTIELGPLGERLHVIFQVEAGKTYGEGRSLEYAYHREFAADRILRETFYFNPRMLTWEPDGRPITFPQIGTPATNTLPTWVPLLGDPTIVERTLLQRPNPISKTVSGDLSAAATVQRIVQRK